jgi:predicted dienelactone hydrolase
MDAPAFVPGDALPAAPALAARGPRSVGVTTLALSHPQQIDVLGSLAAGEAIRATRTLSAEVWYPSVHDGRTTYLDHLPPNADDGDAVARPFRFAGRAARDAEPDRSQGPAPLVVVSHGYPGSRVLLSWLGENLASKGYAVLALDHTDSTHADRADVLSSLRNRPLDIALALRVAADLERHHALLHHVWDSDRTALVGFSMGGYGALVALGAGFDRAALAHAAFDAPLWRELLVDLTLGEPFYEDLVDAVTAKVRSAVLLSPWGGSQVWTDAALARLQVPHLHRRRQRGRHRPLPRDPADLRGRHPRRALAPHLRARAPQRRLQPAARRPADRVARELVALRRSRVGHAPHPQRAAAPADRLPGRAPAGPAARRLPRGRADRGRRRRRGPASRPGRPSGSGSSGGLGGV